jgi:hypothetical protein
MGNDTRCTIEGCDKPHYGRGWCNMHYMRWYTKGTTDDPYVPTLSERFWSKVDAEGDCWEWTGAINPNGYGVFRVGSKNEGAHRFAYTDLVRQIDPGKVIDHLCKNRKCVNIDHLEMTTYSENNKRGAATAVIKNKWSKVTHCKRNHEFTPENTLNGPRRGCRACRDDRRRKVK